MRTRIIAASFMTVAVLGWFHATNPSTQQLRIATHQSCWLERNSSQPGGTEEICGRTALAATPYFIGFVGQP